MPNSPYPTQQKKQAVVFKIVFITSLHSNEPSTVWHESEVEVTTENGTNDTIHLPLATAQAPNVTFTTDSTDNRGVLSFTTPVEDFCHSINQAKQERKMLRFYLLSQPKFHCCQDVSRDSSGVRGMVVVEDTISLASLISLSSTFTDRSMKMSLRLRLLLALNLASTLFQLHQTPWLDMEWFKDNIQFLSPPGAPSTAVIPSKIDISRPLIIHSFASPDTLSNPLGPLCPTPRDALLTLGLMLLEIWHETSLEDYFHHQDLGSSTDYITRASFAQRWLEASEDAMVPDYYAVTARCIRCQFNGIPMNPTWQNEALEKGIAEGILEPLLGLCRPSQY